MLSIFNMMRKLKEPELVKQIERTKAVRVDPPDEVVVENPTGLRLLSKGKKYALFQLDESHSVAVYTKAGKAEAQYFLLGQGAKYGITPNAYAYGDYYVVMDLVPVFRLEGYLEENEFTRELAAKILELHRRSKEAGFTGGHAPKDIIMLPNGSLMAVNVSNKYTPPDFPPKSLLKGLGNRVRDFLRHVRELEPALYEQWVRHPEASKYVGKEVTWRVFR
ncbi:hypothetical protein [Paenibacillus thermotolerans]|uniref:hypothetical protein n=1 Tax=Paenibacillus thermotolerans TaxID=3027807 RepID=UPI002367493F|nr:MULTISPECIES: hypothetical protein [unclassified Paenibacillus]